MNTSWLLRGIELRYVLTLQLFLHGPATISALLEQLEWHGFEPGRIAHWWAET
jgi:hypothetical protein